MKTINLTKIKKNGTKLIDPEEPTFLLVNSEVKSVMVPPEKYFSMQEALEDYLDLKEIEEVKENELIDADKFFEDLENEDKN